MEKLQFEFAVKATTDGKSNILCITSITTPKGRTFSIPTELQPVALHTEVIKTSVFSKIKNQLKKRHQKRDVWINLTEELETTYIDESGNMQFNEFILEDVTLTKEPDNENTLIQILQKLVTKESGPQNLAKLSEKFIIEKYTSKNANADQWMESFEHECERFDITADEKKIELLRYFLEKNTLDWYNSMMLKITINAEWKTWRSKFCETYVNKGWNSVTYALFFKYIEGPLVDYAVRKERLLVEMNKSMDTKTLIDLIAVGLPTHILNRIDRETLKETEDLFNELNKYEYLTKKKIFKNDRNISTGYKGKMDSKQPCTICKRLNKGIRIHPEATCWFKKTTEDEQEKGNPIRRVNNSVIEAELMDETPKNE